MGHLGAGARGDQRGEPGIAEQVQHLDRPPRALDQAGHVIPVRGLLGKDADMAERGEAAEIVDAVMPHRPGLAERRLREAPAAHAFLVGVAGEDRVGLLPVAGRQRLLPDRLAFGPDDAIGAVLLELLAAAAVEQRVVGIGRDFEDQRQALGWQRAVAAAAARAALGCRSSASALARRALRRADAGSAAGRSRCAGGCRGVCRAKASRAALRRQRAASATAQQRRNKRWR